MNAEIKVVIAKKYGGLTVTFDRPDSKHVNISRIGRFSTSWSMGETVDLRPLNTASEVFNGWKRKNGISDKIKYFRLSAETTKPIYDERLSRVAVFESDFFAGKVQITAGWSNCEPHWVIEFDREKIETKYGLDAFSLVHGVAADAWSYYSIFGVNNLPDRGADITVKVVDFLAARIASKKSVEDAENSHLAAKFASARTTGLKQLVDSYMIDHEQYDSSFSYVCIWAMPDGSTTRTETPCY